MKFKNHFIRFEAVLEAPLWVLAIGIALVTLAVVATAVSALP